MPDLADWRARLRLAVELSERKHWLIAEDAGITPTTLSRVLHGWHPNPGFETVVRVTHAVGEQVGWILREPRTPLGATDIDRMREIAAFMAERFPKKNPP